MFKSIRSIVYLSFFIVGLSCFLIIILGARQHQLSGRYEETSELSEKALFAFATIREQITESLIVRDYRGAKDIIPEIEELNNTISRLYDSAVIPGQYKLAMADKLDLTGFVISLRKLDSDEDMDRKSLALQQEMRLISESLIKVDRIITGQINDSLAGFQLGMIGAMGVLISCASFILIMLYRKAVRPLLELVTQAESPDVEKKIFVCPEDAGTEIVEFVESVNELSDHAPPRQLDDEGGEMELVSRTINETANGLNGMINYAQLLLESAAESDIPSEQRDMLERIIRDGERIAELWQGINRRFHP